MEEEGGERKGEGGEGGRRRGKEKVVREIKEKNINKEERRRETCFSQNTTNTHTPHSDRRVGLWSFVGGESRFRLGEKTLIFLYEKIPTFEKKLTIGFYKK